MASRGRFISTYLVSSEGKTVGIRTLSTRSETGVATGELVGYDLNPSADDYSKVILIRGDSALPCVVLPDANLRVNLSDFMNGRLLGEKQPTKSYLRREAKGFRGDKEVSVFSMERVASGGSSRANQSEIDQLTKDMGLISVKPHVFERTKKKPENGEKHTLIKSKPGTSGLSNSIKTTNVSSSKKKPSNTQKASTPKSVKKTNNESKQEVVTPLRSTTSERRTSTPVCTGTPIRPGVRNFEIRDDLNVSDSASSNSDDERACLTYMQTDLFSTQQGCLIHCISADIAMSKGIAATFSAKFRDNEKLKQYAPLVCPGAYMLEPDQDTPLYRGVLVTKVKKSDKPTESEIIQE